MVYLRLGVTDRASELEVHQHETSRNRLVVQVLYLTINVIMLNVI